MPFKHLYTSQPTQLTPQLQRSVEFAQEKGSSPWLTVLPMAEHGFLLHKGEFCDAVCLRYGWNLSNIPRSCNCGIPFSIDHAMICHMGGIPTIRHNEICDMTANLLTEICHNVATEPLLQPLTAQRTLMPTLASISVLVGFGTLGKTHF